MKGSHAPSLRTLTRRMMEDELCLPRGTRLLLAVSGGPDSTAMLHVLSTLAEPLGLVLAAHGVDHGLREESAAELRQAAELARSIGVPFSVSRLDVGRGPNLQARARAARYEALRAAAKGALIATAHTADDRAETFLLRMLRGSGAFGLAVLPPSDGDRVRPMVRASRAAVTLHLQRHGLGASKDPSNDDPRFARVRVRHEVLPLLIRENPKIVKVLNDLADELTELRSDPSPLSGFNRAQREMVEAAARKGRAVLIRRHNCEEVLVRLAGPHEVLINRARGPRNE